MDTSWEGKARSRVSGSHMLCALTYAVLSLCVAVAFSLCVLPPPHFVDSGVCLTTTKVVWDLNISNSTLSPWLDHLALLTLTSLTVVTHFMLKGSTLSLPTSKTLFLFLFCYINAGIGQDLQVLSSLLRRLLFWDIKRIQPQPPLCTGAIWH